MNHESLVALVAVIALSSGHLHASQCQISGRDTACGGNPDNPSLPANHADVLGWSPDLEGPDAKNPENAAPGSTGASANPNHVLEYEVTDDQDLYVQGGRGADGIIGAEGDPGVDVGETGGGGFLGGNGGVGGSVKAITKDGLAVAVGGNGGNGARGGTGGSGGPGDPNSEPPRVAGDGGPGGPGGTGGKGGDATAINRGTLGARIAISGAGGKKGLGGYGGPGFHIGATGLPGSKGTFGSAH